MPPGSSIHHRNRPKRSYIQRAQYFVTSVTCQRSTCFAEPLFADLFVADLWFAKELKELELFGYSVLPDHVHILFQPIGKPNCSQIMGTLKRNVSRDINDLIRGYSFLRNAVREVSRNLVGDKPKDHVGDDSNRLLQGNYEKTKRAHPHLPFSVYRKHFDQLETLRRCYAKKNADQFHTSRFRWQRSFHDHLIREQRDFENHLEYICTNAVKHGLVESPEDWPWMWISGMPFPLLTN